MPKLTINEYNFGYGSLNLAQIRNGNFTISDKPSGRNVNNTEIETHTREQKWRKKTRKDNTYTQHRDG